MNWFVAGGIFLIVCGAVWLILTQKRSEAISARSRVSALTSGTAWILIGLGILIVGRFNDDGKVANIGVGLIVLGVVIRVATSVALRALH